MEGQRFCGSEDVEPEMLKDEEEVNFTDFKHFSLFNVLLQVEPAVPFLIEQLSKAMHIAHWRQGGGVEDVPPDPFFPRTPSEGPSRDGEILNF